MPYGDKYPASADNVWGINTQHQLMTYGDKYLASGDDVWGINTQHQVMTYGDKYPAPANDIWGYIYQASADDVYAWGLPSIS